MARTENLSLGRCNYLIDVTVVNSDRKLSLLSVTLFYMESGYFPPNGATIHEGL